MSEGEFKPIVKEIELSQVPEIPWDQWFEKMGEQFAYWGVEEQHEFKKGELPGLAKMPNLPPGYRGLGLPPFNFRDIIETNKKIRDVRGEGSSDVFYRPGLGTTNIAEEILDKIGAYKTIIVTDLVYAGREMTGWSEGVLPVDFYVRLLNALGAKDAKVSLSSDYRIPGREVDQTQHKVLEIPKGGMATIDCTINGVNLTFRLLTEDMTKLDIGSYQILSFGQPTPFHKADQSDEEAVSDPRYDINFQVRAIENLSLDGVICYSGGFDYFPRVLPLESYGFSEVYSGSLYGARIAQKVEDLGDRLAHAYQTAATIEAAKFALSATHPEVVWYGYYKNAPQEKQVTLDDVLDAYREKIEEISRFVYSIPDRSIQMKAMRRIEFLLMNPIATNGMLDRKKIMKIAKAPEDLDDPKKKVGFGPYFGNPRGLIEDHNAGNVDIFQYYKRLISEFYTRFPQLKQPS